MAIAEKGLLDSYVAKNVPVPDVVFIHYSQQAGSECAGNVAVQLRAQGIVARVDPKPQEATGQTRLDFFNSDSQGAKDLLKMLTPILGIAPPLKSESVQNNKNYFGLWLNECRTTEP
jgi:hypothetical protein